MTYPKDVVAKATNIITEIDHHVNDNCEHCRQLLKNAGLRAQQQTDDSATNPGTNRIDQEVIR